MKAIAGNPAGNKLGPGVGHDDVVGAISASGYPLQSVVARTLRKHFRVQEEWGFIDIDDNTARSMDLMAERLLYKLENPQPHVRPTLNLLVECKRSELPYVFFLSPGAIPTPRFPLIAGVASEDISISTDDDPATWIYSTISALGLTNHDFLTKATFATNFTRCERQNAKLRLSGAEPYNSLVQPLMKAVNHFRKVEHPPSTAAYYDLHAVIALAVIDAPMVGTNTTSSTIDAALVPWVRVPRHKGLDGRSHEHRSNVFALDIVHVGFLETYVEQHLLPFAEQFSAKALKHHVELAQAKAFVPSMGSKWHREVEPLMVPRSLAKAASRVSSAAKRLVRGPTKRK